MHSRFVRGAFGLLLAASAASLFLISTSGAAEAPSQVIVEKALKGSWDKSAIPKSVLTLNSVKFGPAYKATAQEVQVEGMPSGMVTPAVVDFTVRTYYNSETQAVRRVREARVYKDKMGDWAVMTGSPKGEDVSTKEPAVK